MRRTLCLPRVLWCLSADSCKLMTMNATEQLLHAVYKAFNARNIPAVLEKMHPEVDWPNGMEGGRVYGHRGVREYWETAVEAC
jgi:hypothetical protein